MAKCPIDLAQLDNALLDLFEKSYTSSAKAVDFPQYSISSAIDQYIDYCETMDKGEVQHIYNLHKYFCLLVVYGNFFKLARYPAFYYFMRSFSMSIDDSTYGPGRRIYSFNSKGISFYTENRFLPMATRSFFIGYSNGRFTLSNAEPGHDYLEGYRVLLNRLEGLMDRVEAIYNFLIQSSQFNHYLLCEMVDSEVWNKWEKLVGTNFLEKNPIAISFDYKRVIAMNPFQKEESNVDIGAFLRSVSEKDKKIAELEAELARYRRGEAHRERNSDTPAVTLRLEDSIKDQSKIEEMLNGSVAEKVVPEKRKMRRPDYLKGNNPDFQIAMDKSRDALFGTRNIVKKFDLSLLSSELIYGLSPKVPIAKNELVNTQRTFTNREAAEMLKVSTRTLQEYRKKGLINCSQCERRVVYTQQDIDDYMNNHRS